MRKTYSRAGLSIVALYGVMSMVSSVFIGVFAGVGIGILLGQGDLLSQLGSDFGRNFSMIMDLLEDDALMEWLEAHFKGRRFRGYKIDGFEVQLLCHPTRRGTGRKA